MTGVDGHGSGQGQGGVRGEEGWAAVRGVFVACIYRHAHGRGMAMEQGLPWQLETIREKM